MTQFPGVGAQIGVTEVTLNCGPVCIVPGA